MTRSRTTCTLTGTRGHATSLHTSRVPTSREQGSRLLGEKEQGMIRREQEGRALSTRLEAPSRALCGWTRLGTAASRSALACCVSFASYDHAL